MTDLITVTIAVPTSLIGDANELARCVGYGAADGETFREASWQDGDGQLYAVASGPVWPAFLSVPYEPLVAPEWGADMEAAGRALAALLVSDMRAPADGGDPPEAAPADPEHIVAVIGPDGMAAVALLGLVPVPEPEDIG